MFVVLYNYSLYLVAFFVFVGGSGPRIFFELFDRKRHLALLYVDYFDRHFISHFKEMPRVVYQTPVDFRNVYQTLEPLFQFYKCAKVYHAGYLALDNRADLVAGDEVALFFIVQPFLRKNKLTFLWSGRYDGNRKLFAHQLAQFVKYFVFVAV